jgi:uncharacterized membrane protein
MACGILAFVMWPVLVHLSITTEQSSIAAYLLAAVLTGLAATVLRLGFLTIAVGASALVVMGVLRPIWLIHASPLLIYLILAWLFGGTLHPGGKPMVSRFAELEQGDLSVELACYTRRLTYLWTIFFLFMAFVSIVLAVVAPIEVWSLFNNLVSYLMVATLFLGEFVWRHYRFPALRHASPLRLIRLIRQSGALRRGPPVCK